MPEQSEKQIPSRPMVPMYTQDLDIIECHNPNCENHDHPLFLGATCHQGAGIQASYIDGKMTMSCAVCGKPVCIVVIATAEVQ